MKFITIIALLACGALVSAAEPHIKNKEKEFERDGVKLQENDRSIYLDTARIIYLTRAEKGKKNLTTEKWGDFFFGLEFGRPVRSNGGWNIWSFIEIFYHKNGRYVNAMNQYWPESVTLSPLPDRTMADVVTQLDDNAADGKVNIRLVQFKSMPNWLFVKAKFDSSAFKPWRLNLSAYPGNSNNPPERERWAATKENQYNLSGGAIEFKPSSAGVILFSKFVHEDFGNMFVFNPDEFEKVVMPKAGAAVITHFFPKKDVTEFHFALSYFSEKPLADIMPRFLGEEVDHIANFMRGIDWNPPVKADDFDKTAAEVSQTIQNTKALGSNVESLEKELAAIQAEHKAAIDGNNTAAAAAAAEKLNQLKARAAGAGLNSFK